MKEYLCYKNFVVYDDMNSWVLSIKTNTSGSNISCSRDFRNRKERVTMEIVFDASSSMCPIKLRNPETILYRDVWSCEVSVLANYNLILKLFLIFFIGHNCVFMLIYKIAARFSAWKWQDEYLTHSNLTLTLQGWLDSSHSPPLSVPFRSSTRPYSGYTYTTDPFSSPSTSRIHTCTNLYSILHSDITKKKCLRKL